MDDLSTPLSSPLLFLSLPVFISHSAERFITSVVSLRHYTNIKLKYCFGRSVLVDVR